MKNKSKPAHTGCSSIECSYRPASEAVLSMVVSGRYFRSNLYTFENLAHDSDQIKDDMRWYHAMRIYNSKSLNAFIRFFAGLLRSLRSLADTAVSASNHHDESLTPRSEISSSRESGTVADATTIPRGMDQARPQRRLSRRTHLRGQALYELDHKNRARTVVTETPKWRTRGRQTAGQPPSKSGQDR